MRLGDKIKSLKSGLLVSLGLAVGFAVFVGAGNQNFIVHAEAKTSKKKKVRTERVPSASPKELDPKGIEKYKNRQAKRLPKINEYKRRHIIGEKDDGFLGIYSFKKVSTKEKKKVMKLIKAENDDREKIYKKVTKHYKFNKVQAKALRLNFFKSNRRWGPMDSYYYQAGKWYNKKE